MAPEQEGSSDPGTRKGHGLLPSSDPPFSIFQGTNRKWSIWSPRSSAVTRNLYPWWQTNSGESPASGPGTPGEEAVAHPPLADDGATRAGGHHLLPGSDCRASRRGVGGTLM